MATEWKRAKRQPVEGKITACRRAIIKWSKEKYQNNSKKVKENQEALEAALVSPQADQHLIYEITRTLAIEYKAEDEYWKQHSRLLWLQLGDRNMGYFHAVT